MVIGIHDPVSNHRVDLEQPYLFAYSHLGFGLKGLFTGDFLNHLVTTKNKNIFELDMFINEFVEVLHKQANSTIYSYIRHKKPLPNPQEIVEISVGAISPTLSMIDTENEFADLQSLLEILKNDIVQIRGSEREILYPYFELAKELTQKFHCDCPGNYLGNFPSDVIQHPAFVVVGANFNGEPLDGVQSTQEYMRTEYLLDDGWVILFFFSVDSFNKDTFLAAPVMLMHELVSHVVTTDFGTGFYSIASRSFLEGWMVWAIEEYLENCEPIQFLSNRVDSFKLLRYETYNSSDTSYSASIRMGRETARWFCKQLFGWNAFLKISQELLLITSDPKDTRGVVNYLSPSPEINVHDEFIGRLNYLMRQMNGKRGLEIYRRLREIFPKAPDSFTECWNGIFDASLN